MVGKEGNLKGSHDRIAQLEEEIKALRSNHKATLLKLEGQLAIEKRYEESQERFRTIFEQSKFGNKIIGSDLKIIQVNQALQAMLGYSEKELTGTKITDYAHPDFINHWHELQERLWAKQISFFQLETCLIKKDGSILWCGITTILFKDNEATLGYTILEDISQRKALEEKLQKHTVLLNTGLEDFVYTASHDLKSPVVNIEGLLIILAKKLTNKFTLDDEQNRLLSMIGASVDRLKLTIADLTEIAKVQKEEVEEEMVSVTKLIDEVYEELAAISTHLPVKLEKQIEVNEIKFACKNLRSIIQNLLSNAIKYHFPERLPEISIRTQRQESYVVIIVEDNGIGIAKNHLEKLFTMFKRFHTHVEGTGIGLYIIKRIVENAGGKIEVESTPDIGTVFKVYLPQPLAKHRAAE